MFFIFFKKKKSNLFSTVSLFFLFFRIKNSFQKVVTKHFLRAFLVHIFKNIENTNIVIVLIVLI